MPFRMEAGLPVLHAAGSAVFLREALVVPGSVLRPAARSCEESRQAGNPRHGERGPLSSRGEDPRELVWGRPRVRGPAVGRGARCDSGRSLEATEGPCPSQAETGLLHGTGPLAAPAPSLGSCLATSRRSAGKTSLLTGRALVSLASSRSY